jgi:hypothetical protein
MLSETLTAGLEHYEIGPKIRALRWRKKLGLVQLGQHTGLSPALLSKIERGQLLPIFCASQSGTGAVVVCVGRLHELWEQRGTGLGTLNASLIYGNNHTSSGAKSASCASLIWVRRLSSS